MNSAAQREAFAELVRQHQPVGSPKWRELMELRDSISEARKKGASFETIRIYLGKTAVIVSADTVARFCHEVLGEPKARRPWQRKIRSPRRNGIPLARPPAGQHLESSVALRCRPSSGPRIVDPKSL